MTKTTQLILQILNTEKPRLFQYASYRLHQICDVEDALQNLCVKALSNKALFREVANPKAYIYRMLSNECTTILRYKSKAQMVSLDTSQTMDFESLQPENFDEEFKLINQLLAQLPFEQSETIRFRLHSDLSFQEIADIMKVPLPTAKARFRYGIEKIRTSLKQHNLL